MGPRSVRSPADAAVRVFLPTTLAHRRRRLLAAVGLASLAHLALLWWLAQTTVARAPSVATRAAAAVWVTVQQAVRVGPRAPASPAETPPARPRVAMQGAADAPPPRVLSPLPPTTTAPVTSTASQAAMPTEAGVRAAAPADGAAPGLAAQPPGTAAPLVLELRPERRQPRVQSYAEQANAQLNRGARRDALAEGIQDAAVPDCTEEGQRLGLLALPVLVLRAASGRC